MSIELRSEWGAAVCTIALVTATIADDFPKASPDSAPVREPDARQSRERADDLARLTKIAAGYTLKLEKAGQAEMRREPAFRWSNPPAATNDAAWHYAMGPMTGWEATGWCGDKRVWSQKHLNGANNPKLPYFVTGPFPGP